MTKNITLAIDEELLNRARIYAAERKTTVNAMVRDFLAKTLSQEQRLADARRKLRSMLANSKAEIGSDYVWNREEIYDGPRFSRYEHPRLRGGGEEG